MNNNKYQTYGEAIHCLKPILVEYDYKTNKNFALIKDETMEEKIKNKEQFLHSDINGKWVELPTKMSRETALEYYNQKLKNTFHNLGM